ncbi:MAG: hypothetical protein COT26_01380 [Candidatus Kerfeldbacteria bacterium CG08_land_8_20_14_0_20_43_14]|uniref:DUF721 domain-containing protein n=1 Tax=Candidatus Kerfeldbacteria bacterium CG08_land_8_20_14_0_20_43_14 TaxID=2014246 RepID=A0A2H0YQM5_9BACT|nr:MAG: hypothetical protein COT26_01380 [Candidatus Kerfeldbacteria bacterium CG08_land_8_20_14_0_20_43_14]
MGFSPIKYTLNRNIQSSGLQNQVDGARVIEIFALILKEVLGEEFNEKAKALYLKNRILTISVISSVTGQEIKLREVKIVEAINRKMEANLVERLRFLA